MRRHIIGLAVTLVLMGACGQSDGGNDVPGGTPSPSAGGEYAQVLAFAKCMRENGLPDFPDPAPDGSLDAGGGTIDRTSTQYRNALEACQTLRPGGTGGKPGVDAEQLAQMGKYAKCMRENGLPDFPDPGPNGFDPGAFNNSDPAYAAAAKACQEFLTWRG